MQEYAVTVAGSGKGHDPQVAEGRGADHVVVGQQRAGRGPVEGGVRQHGPFAERAGHKRRGRERAFVARQGAQDTRRVADAPATATDIDVDDRDPRAQFADRCGGGFLHVGRARGALGG